MFSALSLLSEDTVWRTPDLVSYIEPVSSVMSSKARLAYVRLG